MKTISVTSPFTGKTYSRNNSVAGFTHAVIHRREATRDVGAAEWATWHRSLGIAERETQKDWAGYKLAILPVEA